MKEYIKHIYSIKDYSPIRLCMILLISIFVTYGISELLRIIASDSLIVGILTTVIQVIPFSILLMYYLVLGNVFIAKTVKKTKGLDNRFNFIVILILVTFLINSSLPFESEYLTAFLITGLILFVSYSIMIWLITKLFFDILEGENNETVIIASIEYRLFWVLPIGIWFLNKRIREIIETKSQTPNKD